MPVQFISFTTMLGQPITVNLNRIISIAPNHDPRQAGTAIRYGDEGERWGDGYIFVRETYEHVISVIDVAHGVINGRRSEVPA